ncbi:MULTISPECIES: SDR family NAD(P)-dependent oxidoreductase [unclassified Streptomyces]|uniref:SDR family NAD(P)-dependent oxidoreductase n=1 Tax=unclassified Streptomyces TaxID=2593676 RepID=UPI00381284FC
MKRLNGKVALITGTAGAQGRAAARLFAAEGAHVFGVDLDGPADKETEALVTADGGTMTSLSPVELTDEEQVRDVVEQVVRLGGRLDILYNNASAARMAPFADMTGEDWHFTLRNELDLVYYACRSAWPHLARARAGSVVNTGSTLGSTGMVGLGASAHCAAKAAVIGLTRQLAVEGGPLGIRANTVSPSLLPSRGTADLFTVPGSMAAVGGMSLLGTVASPDDVARAALYLASDEARFVTGTDLLVDGGTTAHLKSPLAGPPAGDAR